VGLSWKVIRSPPREFFDQCFRHNSISFDSIVKGKGVPDAFSLLYAFFPKESCVKLLKDSFSNLLSEDPEDERVEVQTSNAENSSE
jgi:hypothetical protein